MPIDQTMRGLALEIDASLDPASEAQPVLEYRFIDLASTQTILARIKGIPQPNGGGELAFETNAGGAAAAQRMQPGPRCRLAQQSDGRKDGH